MDENQPVDEGEYVYRRIHRQFYDPTLPMSIERLAFKPTSNDTTGISVFRARFVNPADILANIEAGKRNNYFVAQLAVHDLLQLGLTVVPDPDPNGPPGHAIIPEMNLQAYQADKDRLTRIQVELANLASTAVVHQPS